MPQTKEQRKETRRQHYLKNKEKIKETRRQYYLKNKEKEQKQKRQYYKTPQGIKVSRMTNWRNRGIICDDYDALYERYLNTTNCENCDCILTEDKRKTKTTRCLDHDHTITDRENVRNILCHSCNIKRK
jgi:hypothetical protein